jgi:26S proteasome non-ATPase regulatory subunit 10
MFDLCQFLPTDAVRHLKVLLQTGAAHPNVQRGDGNSPLHLAVQCGSSAMVALLLHTGARVSIANIKGETALHIAVRSKNCSILQDMLSYYSKHGRLLSSIIDVDAADNMGCSPLHIAAFVGYAPSLECLIKSGASLVVRDKGGAS